MMGVEEDKRQRRKTTAANDELPVSLVIPVRNEAASLAALFASIQNQTYAPAEIIIVDGGSSDETVAIAQRLTQGDARYRLIEAGPASPGRGRNIGIGAARHEWVALTDAGIALEPVWLAELIAAARRDQTLDVVYGNYESRTDSRFERCAALAYAAPKQIRAGEMMRGPSIASALLRRTVWHKVGGFPDHRAAEDLIFMERVEQQGFRIGWAPRATVWWSLRPDLTSTLRKFALYSKHNVWAGRERYWHYGVARQYIVWLAVVTLAIITRNAWWLLLIALGFAARTFKSIWTRRENRSAWWALEPRQFVCVAFLLACIDAATFVGWIQAYVGVTRTVSSER